jgi:hypothetical protein
MYPQGVLGGIANCEHFGKNSSTQAGMLEGIVPTIIHY